MRLRGQCIHCEVCRSRQFQLCREQPFVGSIQDGGHAEMMIARETGPVSIARERSIMGSITGSPFENGKTLSFSLLSGVRPKVETMPLEKANEAYQKMRSGEVEFRMVLTM